MSLATDLADVFAEKEMTHPISYLGQTNVRGFFDREGTLRSMMGTHVETMQNTLYVVTGALANLRRDEPITLGALGAETAVGGVVHTINDFRPIDDGGITAIALSGAP